MIQKFTLFIATLFLLSACSNHSLMKRRYTKGYYLASAKGNGTSKRDSEPKKAATSLAPNVEQVIVKAPEQVPTLSQPAAAPVEAPVTLPKHAASNVTALKDAKTVTAPGKTPAVAPLQSLLNHKQAAENKQQKASDDAMFIVMVILCFFWFLNLISVYLHDDDITLNFWITLLLDFTFIGGIIFSLLVVLDIVDLR